MIAEVFGRFLSEGWRHEAAKFGGRVTLGALALAQNSANYGSEKAPSLLELLVRYYCYLPGDRRDKIYALVGLGERLPERGIQSCVRSF
jgi:hypothetical protein